MNADWYKKPQVWVSTQANHRKCLIISTRAAVLGRTQRLLRFGDLIYPHFALLFSSGSLPMWLQYWENPPGFPRAREPKGRELIQGDKQKTLSTCTNISPCLSAAVHRTLLMPEYLLITCICLSFCLPHANSSFLSDTQQLKILLAESVVNMSVLSFLLFVNDWFVLNDLKIVLSRKR